MSDRDLKLHDNGSDVSEAQELLNRAGAMLVTDGDFGKATDTAVREFQTVSGMSATGVIDAATWRTLRALGEPSSEIPTRAVTFICREEVSSREFYDSRCARPTWPGLSSGVTIGVGYDLGFQSNFEVDWAGLLSPQQIAALRPCVGKKGQAAADAIAQLSGVVIPWQAAWAAFIRKTLPQEISSTRLAFARTETLPALCLGVLVSLVYNRGPQLTDPPGSDARKEMRDIRDAVAAGRFVDVPAALRSMKRIWPEGNGLRDRREREAKLFEEGLLQAKTIGA